MNLNYYVGFDVILDENTGLLNFPEVPDYNNLAVRTYHDSRPYYLEDKYSGDEILYWMYRDICLPQHANLIHSHNLKYDITVLRPGIVGTEFIKTIGHYHPPSDKGGAYPEIYEVLHGKALYLMQNEDVTDSAVVEAFPGDQVFIPPGYGHITINHSNTFLVMSNVVSNQFTSVYNQIKDLRGACWYCIEESGKPKWIKNDRYTTIPTLRNLPPKQMPLLPGVAEPLYKALIANPKIFECMNVPQLSPGFA